MPESGAAGPSAGEKIVAGPPGFHFLEDRERAIRQRNAMLAAFVRAGGTVQTLQAKSISSQRAAAASPERAVARIANSRAHAAVVGRSRRLATKGGTSPCRARSGREKAIKLRSVMATVGASGAVTFQLIANIPPARAADSVQVRGTIVNLDRSMPR